MRRLLALSVLPSALFILAGCTDTGGAAAAPRDDMFIAREVKIHPVFTRINDWTGDGKPDGIDALVELHDQFGDTTKGSGTFMFELFEYRRDQPDPRGHRLSNPWLADVVTPEQQRARWSKTSRCYTFRLQSDQVARGSYVFAVTFTPTNGPRAFDQVVLVNRAAADTTQPSGQTELVVPPEDRPIGSSNSGSINDSTRGGNR